MARGKKGELTSQQIVVIVLAIIGFLIVLGAGAFLLFGSSNGLAGEEACRLAVLSRGTVPEAGQGYIPLKCTTSKLCLTDGNGTGKCGSSFVGEEASMVKLPASPTDAARKIEENLANKMYDCWSMMGEGKISLFTKGMMDYHNLNGAKKPVCVICSRISLEHAKISDVLDTIKDGVNLDNYLANAQVPGSGETYLQKFTDQQFKSFASTSDINVKDLTSMKQSASFDSSNSNNEMAIVFSQINVDDTATVLTKLLRAGGVGFGGAFAVGGLSLLKALASPYILVPTIIGGAVVGTVAVSNAYAGMTAAAEFCGKLSTTLSDKDKKQGCSAVMILPYDVKVINKICTGGYEGSP